MNELQGKLKYTDKTYPLSFCPPQILAAAVESRRLTA
jgi:hypothetical protein